MLSGSSSVGIEDQPARPDREERAAAAVATAAAAAPAAITAARANGLADEVADRPVGGVKLSPKSFCQAAADFSASGSSYALRMSAAMVWMRSRKLR
jgi:hypothetical protein